VRSSAAPLAVLLVSGTSLAKEIRVDSPAPAPPDGPPAVAPSFVRLEVALPLDPAIEALDAAAPTELGSDAFEPYEDVETHQTVEIRYGIRREPIAAELDHDHIVLLTELFYWLEVRGDGIEPTGCASAADPIGIRTRIEMRLGWTDDWRVDTQITPQPITFLERCKPKPPGVNFTSFLTARVQEKHVGPLGEAAASALGADDRFARSAAAAWNALHARKELRLPGAALVMRPSGMRAFPIGGTDRVIRADLAIEVQPEIVAVASASAAAAPLPPPRVRLSDGIARVPVDLEIAWSDANASLQSDLVGRKYALGEHRMEITGIRGSGTGNRIRFDVDLRGTLSGTIHLDAAPVYDDVAHVLSAGGVELSPETADAVRGTSGAEEALGKVAADVESEFRFAVEDELGRRLDAIGRAVNQPWAEGVALRGGLARRRTLGTYVSESGFGVRIEVSGEVWVRVEG
jgi:hypothetical protein